MRGVIYAIDLIDVIWILGLRSVSKRYLIVMSSML